MTPTATSHESHPCFGLASRSRVGRLHLPVAPRANSRSKFADSTKIKPAMQPEEALRWLDRTIADGNEIGIVGISGPGDPLAVPGPTLRTLRLVREKYPEISLCLTTCGLGGAPLAGELAEIGLSHVTLLVDAVDPAIAEKMYAWIRPSTKTVPLDQAAEVLVDEQSEAIKAFKKAGIPVKINTTVYPGYNADHLETIAATVAGLGADIMAVVPFWPGEAVGEFPAVPDMDLLETVRDKAARHMDLMPSWEACGESLVGLKETSGRDAHAIALPKPTKERPNVAVVSASGMDVDLHLGHATKALIYGPREDGLACLLEARDLPVPGSGEARWEKLAELLSDCFVLLTSSAGQNPREVLSRNGLTVFITDGEIAPTVDVLYGGGKKGKKCKK
jgi:nitrogen fixation protein NifB